MSCQEVRAVVRERGVAAALNMRLSRERWGRGLSKWIGGVCCELQEALHNSNTLFWGALGQSDDSHDWKSMVGGGIYCMALSTAISLRDDTLPGFTITTVRKLYKLPLIPQTHTAHITPSTVNFILFQDCWGLSFNG